MTWHMGTKVGSTYLCISIINFSSNLIPSKISNPLAIVRCSTLSTLNGAVRRLHTAYSPPTLLLTHCWLKLERDLKHWKKLQIFDSAKSNQTKCFYKPYPLLQASPLLASSIRLHCCQSLCFPVLIWGFIWAAVPKRPPHFLLPKLELGPLFLKPQCCGLAELPSSMPSSKLAWLDLLLIPFFRVINSMLSERLNNCIFLDSDCVELFLNLGFFKCFLMLCWIGYGFFLCRFWECWGWWFGSC